MNLKNRPYLEIESVTNGKIGHRENIKKIKFPFYCYYSKDGLRKKLGLVSDNEGCKYLVDLSCQKKINKDVDQNNDLETLIIDNNIMLVKVKLVLFE